MTGTHQTSLPHKPGNSFAAVPLSASLQLGMDAWRPIRLARTGVHRAHSLQQRPVRNNMGRRRSMDPGVIASLGHAEHARHRGNRKVGLVRAHKPEEPDGTAPVSRANQVAAFERMSRSTRSCLFSRRRRANSSRSEAAKPGTASFRPPSCLSAAAAQPLIDGALGSNSRARSSGDRPAQTIPTI